MISERESGVETTTMTAMTETPEADLPVAKMKHAKGLLAIGLFKLGKALFFFSVGFGALHLVHANIGDLFLSAAAWLHLNLGGQFVGKLEDRADLISGHQLRQVSLLTCGYAVVSLIEGTGLMLEKTWAEYLTLTLTIGALPLEVYEIARHATATKFVVMGANVVVLLYLVWFLKRQRRAKCEAALAVA